MSDIYGKCGKCEREYKTESGYLNHTCKVTGYTPKDPEHNGEEFILASIAAIKRGGGDNEEEIAELKEKREAAHDVSNKIRQNRIEKRERKR